MDAADFLPDETTLARIRRDLAAYEERRKTAYGAVRWRVPVAMGAFALVGAALLAALFDVLSDDRYFYLALAVFGGLGLAGFKLYEFAARPATELQETFRPELFRTLFPFIEDMRHFRSSLPGSFARLPGALVEPFDDQVFDDEFSGRMGDLRFQLYEARLEQRQGKSSRTVFRGIVLSFDLPQSFEGQLVVTPRSGRSAALRGGTVRREGLERLASGDDGLDERYEFRTDNAAAARPLLSGNLGKALAWLGAAFPDRPARFALAGSEAFLLLPARGRENVFELPRISVPLDYERHVASMVVDMARLLALGDLLRKAVVRPG